MIEDLDSSRELKPAISGVREPDFRRFSRWVLRALWEGYSLDGGDIQEAALKYGLIVRTTFDPAKHSDNSGVGVQPGDEWFVERKALSPSTASPA